MQHRLTLSSLVQGAWAKVLSVYSGEKRCYCTDWPVLEDPLACPLADKRVGLFIKHAAYAGTGKL